MCPSTTGQMGGAPQPELTSGDLWTHLLDDVGHHHEVCLQLPGQPPGRQVSEILSCRVLFLTN